MTHTTNPTSSARDHGRPSPAPNLAVIPRRIADLRPDQGNPRRHSAKQIRQVARSIETFGFNVPILVNAAGQVIAGHGRLQACQHLGWEEIPTITLEHLTEAQAKAFMIADNKLTDNSEWDDRLLAEQLKELSLVDLDFSLEDTGFEMGEIDFRIEGLGLGDANEDEPDPADTIPEPVTPNPVSRHGDLWLLGPHRLLCGSALEASDLDRLMSGRQASVVFTDPPYNVPIGGHVTGHGAIQHREFAMASGEMSAEEFTSFLRTSLGLLAKHSKDGSLHYICMDWRHLREVLAAGHQVYTELKNLCVWVKDNAGMGSFYRSQHELVLVFKHGQEPHRNNVQLGQHGRNRSNIWRYPGVNSFGRTTEEGNLLTLHPTVKPVALVADALLDSSARGEVVLDTFLGSGTTLVAAEKVGRVCFGLELDPIYVDTAIRRWQARTGQQVVLATSGLPFDGVAQEREPLVPEEACHG